MERTLSRALPLRLDMSSETESPQAVARETARETSPKHLPEHAPESSPEAPRPTPREAASLPRIGALIRARRREAKMTLQALCTEASLSVGYLSQIERDQATPSLATLAQIARSLGVGVEYFIAAPKVEDSVSPAAGRPRFAIDGSSIIYERISTEFPGSKLSSFVMHVPAGYRSEDVSHEGEEIVYILEGRLTSWLDGKEILLGAGDALHFRGSQTHAWANLTDRPARLLWVGNLTLLQPLTAPKSAPEPAADPASHALSQGPSQKSDTKPTGPLSVQRRQ